MGVLGVCMNIPPPMHSIPAAIDAAMEAQAEPPRPHLGASILGHPCDRWLWLSFRWAAVEKHSGRVLRLFRRGQMEEATIVEDLRAVGVEIDDRQQHVDFGAHVSGSIDAIITGGVPEAPRKRHIAEFKTHSKKSFDDLEKNGVEKSKPMHWAQMQLYMAGTKIDRALYVAVCKDDDRLYTERVQYDKAAAEKLIERGRRIALSDRMPEPVAGASPSWYQCKFCPAFAFCHETGKTENVNCRTCAHSTAKENSTWHCARYDADNIPVDYQRAGCGAHVLHPDLVPWQRDESGNEWEAVYIIDGKPVRNGEGDAFTFTSHELISNPSACASGDAFIGELREKFGARIEG